MGLRWTDFWDALQGNGAFPMAGIALLIIGAAFRWFEPLSRVLGIDKSSGPFAVAHDWIAERRAAGDEAAARRAEARLSDQHERLTRYGRAMMVVGAVIVALSVFLK